MTRYIGFYVFPRFQLLDLAGPLAAFQAAGRKQADPPYRLTVLSRTGGLVETSAGVSVSTQAAPVEPIDTLIVAGGAGALTVSSDELDAVRSLSQRARRTTSVCTGTFVLAKAGLLDGKRATTHWAYGERLQAEHPLIKVDAAKIYVREGAIWTSAGHTAGIDLALALIEDDLGDEVSKEVARQLVVYHRRPGGQFQYAAIAALEPTTDKVRSVLSYIRENLSQELNIEKLAEVACLSLRQFGRMFKDQTGETPARAVERLRTEAARVQIEQGSDPIELVAATVGFADPERMRRAFQRTYGCSPQEIRRAARPR